MVLVWPCIFLLASLYGVSLRKPDEDYMGRPQTTAVKGIFAWIIFMSHVRGYIDLSGSAGEILNWTMDHIGQLMVTMFFFYSGYGVIESFRNKKGYARRFPKRRILKTLIHFDCAILLYLFYGLVSGKHYPVINYFLCWIGWTSIGNSNWFVFIVLVLYLFTWLSFLATEGFKDEPKRSWLIIFLITCLSVAVSVVLKISGKESYWYNTILCYPLGMAFSLSKKRVDSMLKTLWRWILASLVVFSAFVFLYFMDGAIAYCLCACCFCLLTVLVTMKIRISNRVLLLLGQYSFHIFILQRLPMMMFRDAGISNGMLVIPFAFLITLAISFAFDIAMKWIDGKVFR